MPAKRALRPHRSVPERLQFLVDHGDLRVGQRDRTNQACAYDQRDYSCFGEDHRCVLRCSVLLTSPRSSAAWEERVSQPIMDFCPSQPTRRLSRLSLQGAFLVDNFNYGDRIIRWIVSSVAGAAMVMLLSIAGKRSCNIRISPI